MLAEIPRNTSVSSFVWFLKGKSSLMIHERHWNFKHKYGNLSFWCRGYYVDTAGKNVKKIQEYIKNQIKEDQIHDQMTLKEYTDPITDRRNQSLTDEELYQIAILKAAINNLFTSSRPHKRL